MTRIRAKVEYEGTRYHGFQRQPGRVTVESALTDALLRVTGEEVKVQAASRTDAGVHARGQIIAFDTGSRIPPERFACAMNAVLPGDIRVLASMEADPGFHPRYDARAKSYQYLIYRDTAGRTFYRHLSYYYPYPLDVQAMKEAATLVEGTHDFRAFCARRSGTVNFTRTVYKCQIVENPPLLTISVCGNGFLYNMVRIIVGTLLEVGRHKLNPGEMEAVILSGRRDRAGPTVPAAGLYLMEVFY